MIDIEANRCYTIDRLTSTERPGIDELIEYMDEAKFFTSPCSTQYHLCCNGGLAEHSINVYHHMKSISQALCDIENVPSEDTIIICSFLHDLGKVGDFGKALYVENLIKDGRPTKALPEQMYKQSLTKPFVGNSDILNIPHEVTSVITARRFIELTEDEQHAILFHSGMYGDLRYAWQGHETNLDLLLHFADMWSSRTEMKHGI